MCGGSANQRCLPPTWNGDRTRPAASSPPLRCDLAAAHDAGHGLRAPRARPRGPYRRRRRAAMPAGHLAAGGSRSARRAAGRGRRAPCPSRAARRGARATGPVPDPRAELDGRGAPRVRGASSVVGRWETHSRSSGRPHPTGERSAASVSAQPPELGLGRAGGAGRIPRRSRPCDQRRELEQSVVLRRRAGASTSRPRRRLGCRGRSRVQRGRGPRRTRPYGSSGRPASGQRVDAGGPTGSGRGRRRRRPGAPRRPRTACRRPARAARADRSQRRAARCRSRSRCPWRPARGPASRRRGCAGVRATRSASTCRVKAITHLRAR